MGREWGVSSDQYSWLITAYYLAYLAFQWLLLFWKVVSRPQRRQMWVTLMAIGWGAASILQAATSNFAGIIALRCLIGVFETGFSPGIALFLSFFYHPSEMGFRYGLFISFLPIANCFASALAYGIVHANTAIAEWPLLFIIEGIPTIMIDPLAYILLPKGPGGCRFLTKQENETVRLRALKARGHEEKLTTTLKQVFAAFYDYKDYFNSAIFFYLPPIQSIPINPQLTPQTAFAALPAYLPTIIKDIGYTSIQAQGLSAPPLPYSLRHVPHYHLSLRPTLVKTSGSRYFATYLITAGVFPSVALAFTWVTDNQGSASKRGAGLVLFRMVGQAWAIVGARLFPKEEGPFYVRGMGVSAALLALVLRGLLGWENGRRDERFGVVVGGDSHHGFRFVL
ncbi:hypothetical protein BBP40_002054 [Aspergillus hancockii]|nr:hypothetical protein BBP40_002054 [Aspergillus hancockii]